jgi:hypothetical protein
MKNPWMSMWLSAANTWAGAARGFMTAEMRRQQNAMTREAARTMSGKPQQPKPKSRSSRRKKSL